MKGSSYDDIPSNCALWFPENILGKKWVTKILIELLEASKFPSKSMSYSDITNLIPEISSRTLTRRINEMNEIGLINIHENPVHPTKVRYSLNEAGEELIPIIASIRRWSLKHGNCDNVECLQDKCVHSQMISDFIRKEDVAIYCDIHRNPSEDDL